MFLNLLTVPEQTPSSSAACLKVDEVIYILRSRWSVTYDLRLVSKGKRLYLQVMWAYLEQQSFPLDEATYRSRIADVVEVINRLGLSDEVRHWLCNSSKRPRLGKALSLPLKSVQGLEEFVL